MAGELKKKNQDIKKHLPTEGVHTSEDASTELPDADDSVSPPVASAHVSSSHAGHVLPAHPVREHKTHNVIVEDTEPAVHKKNVSSHITIVHDKGVHDKDIDDKEFSNQNKTKQSQTNQKSNFMDITIKQADRAKEVVQNYMLWTGAAGIIPIPVVDFAAISAIQLSMLNKISGIYDQTFNNNWGKEIIGSLIGGYTATSLGRGIGMNIVRSIPIVGGLLSFVVAPGFAAASTWALGQVFIMHFESGKTLLEFDPVKFKDSYNHYVTEYNKEHHGK
jgi:uncharacterized protein (DUF697 family)